MRFTDRLEDYENEYRIVEGTDNEGNATYIVKSQLNNEVVGTFKTEEEAENFINPTTEVETTDETTTEATEKETTTMNIETAGIARDEALRNFRTATKEFETYADSENRDYDKVMELHEAKGEAFKIYKAANQVYQDVVDGKVVEVDDNSETDNKVSGLSSAYQDCQILEASAHQAETEEWQGAFRLHQILQRGEY